MNLVKKICEHLGVNIGKAWEGTDGNIYKLDEKDGLWNYDKSNDLWFIHHYKINDILTEKVKPKWKPEYQDVYYIPVPHNVSPYKWCLGVWGGDEHDERIYNDGLAFRTKEEATECSEKILRLLKEDSNAEKTR